MSFRRLAKGTSGLTDRICKWGTVYVFLKPDGDMFSQFTNARRKDPLDPYPQASEIVSIDKLVSRNNVFARVNL